mgnify:CR=1 FL=1
MTGKFIITRDHLAQLGACESGMDFFDQTYPEGKAEYQDMLDKAVAGGHTDYATWLLEKVGPTEDVLEVEEINSKELDIVFAGRVFAKLGIIVRRLIAGGGIKAGSGIKAGEGIEAGSGIKAGEGIKAGSGIEAGGGYGIYAGLRVKVTNREYRTIRAKNKPDNIMCGEWVEQ